MEINKGFEIGDVVYYEAEDWETGKNKKYYCRVISKKEYLKKIKNLPRFHNSVVFIQEINSDEDDNGVGFLDISCAIRANEAESILYGR